MREFYEGKLHEMEELLTQKELESEKLSQELKLMDANHSGGKELAEKLRIKQEQILELRKKQQELARLTSVVSRNESQIVRLRNDILEMKQKKVTLQKQIADERKNHALEVQELKKQSMQKDKELNKVKRESDKKAFEAEKAQQVAEARLEQMNQLKIKYKESEKQLRMATVKRGVMLKAGLDPVMVGRRHSKKTSSVEVDGRETVDYDTLRDFFDQKVAEVGRREALAEKLAQEWEEHLELSTKRDEMAQNGDEDSNDALASLDSQIKCKEDRIRQLASRLGKRRSGESDKGSSGNETFLFGSDFEKVTNGKPVVQGLKCARSPKAEV